MSNPEKKITVQQLIDHLRAFPGHYEVDFGGLEFYKIDGKGQDTARIEFSQTVYKDENGVVIIENN